MLINSGYMEGFQLVLGSLWEMGLGPAFILSNGLR